MVGRSYIGYQSKDPYRCPQPCEGVLAPTNRGESYDPENHESVTASAVESGGSRMVSAAANGVEVSSDSSPDNLYHLETGEAITSVAVVRNEDNEVLGYEYYFWNSEKGEMDMTDNTQDIGYNAPAQLTQLVGQIKMTLFDPDSNITKSVEQLLDDASSKGLMLSAYDADGVLIEREVEPDDWVARISASLKPIGGGAGELNETDGRATTSEGYTTDGPDMQNLDGGGTYTYGSVSTDPRGWYNKIQFSRTGEVAAAAGSVMIVDLIVVSDPA